jgi:hypothetical protein
MGLRLGLMVKYKHYWRKKSHRLASHGDWCYSYIHCNILDKADLICDASVFHLHGCICFRQLFRCPLFVSSNVYCPSLYCVIYVCLVVAVAMLTMQQKNQTLYRWDGRPVAQWYWTRPPISGNFNSKRTKLNKATRGAPGEVGESLNLRASARRLDASPLGLSISSLGFVSDYLWAELYLWTDQLSFS